MTNVTITSFSLCLQSLCFQLVFIYLCVWCEVCVYVRAHARAMFVWAWAGVYTTACTWRSEDSFQGWILGGWVQIIRSDWQVLLPAEPFYRPFLEECFYYQILVTRSTRFPLGHFPIITYIHVITYTYYIYVMCFTLAHLSSSLPQAPSTFQPATFYFWLF